MKGFAERERGLEAAIKRDQERAFRITARRNKLFGLWAAGQFGLSAGNADAYAMGVVEADFEAPGDDDIVAKVLADFAENGIATTETALRIELGRAGLEARRQLAET